MADFETIAEENTHYVRAILKNESIRAEAGALAYMRGRIAMSAPIPGPLALMQASLSEEAAVRPTYTGTGEVFLNSSLGGFYTFEIREKPWILEKGAYWASEGTVKLALHRERIFTSFWLDEGLIDFQTKVSGHGKVVLNSGGPVEEIELGDEEMAVEGRLVVARSSRVKFSIRRPSRGVLSSWLSGEKLLRVYKGPGRILMSATPYWGKMLVSMPFR
ncbi:MAG: AIM24 family protein [Alsobacter sp.]